MLDLLQQIPVIDADHLKWLDYKYSVLNKLEFPKYDMITFNEKNMKGTFSLSEKGLCLINVGIGKGENPTEYLSKIALIDTGAIKSVVSEELADILQLEPLGTGVTVKGFEGSQFALHTIISIICNELNLRSPMYVAVVQNTPEGVDLVLGADFLDGFILTRDGIYKTFTLVI